MESIKKLQECWCLVQVHLKQEMGKMTFNAHAKRTTKGSGIAKTAIADTA